MSRHKEYTVKIYEDGTTVWYRCGELHRENGPAIEDANGTKHWYQNGQLHREDGPAVEWADGTKEWWLKGLRHREDGPAFISPDGDKYWYLNGFDCTEEEFLKKVAPVKKYTAAELEKLLGHPFEIIKG